MGLYYGRHLVKIIEMLIRGYYLHATLGVRCVHTFLNYFFIDDELYIYLLRSWKMLTVERLEQCGTSQIS